MNIIKKNVLYIDRSGGLLREDSTKNEEDGKPP